MLTLLYQLSELKWVFQAIILLGAAPNYFTVWSLWRIISLFFPRKAYRVVDDMMWSSYQRYLLFFFESCARTEVVLYGDVEELKKCRENAIVIFNHQSTVDWIVADILAIRQGTLGWIRYILKDGLKYFPLYGFYFRQHSCIYVNKSGEFNERRTLRHFQQLVNHDVPFWFVIFPEGSRFREETHKTSTAYAIKNNLPIFKNVLIPRAKAFQMAMKELHEKCAAVYDMTVAFSDTYDYENEQRILPPSLTDYLRGNCKKLHIHIKRIPLNLISKEPDEVKTWLIERFKQKDQLMNDFYGKYGEEKFDTNGRIDNLGFSATSPSFLVFVTLNFIFLSSPTGRNIYWKSAMLGTLSGWIIMFFNP